MTRYMDTERYRQERDKWIAEQIKNAPPLSERQKVILRANLGPAFQQRGRGMG